MLRFLSRRWFLVALFLALAVGLSLHSFEAAQTLAAWRTLRSTLVAAVMFVMALPLEASAMWRAIRRPLAPGLAATINVGLIPPTAWMLSPLLPPDLAAGLIVAGATPCTLASAAVWTRKAGGNDAVAILVTIVTNASCFLVTPLWVMVLIGEEAATDALRLGPMITKLGTIVVAPMVLAQFFRLRKSFAVWATAKKPHLSIVAQMGILTMVWLGSIRTGERLFGGTNGAPIVPLIIMVGLVLGLHLGAFALGWLLAPAAGLERKDQIAVSFAGSQKTLMVGLQVSMDLGVSILPMITYHVGQLIVDTILAERIREGDAGAGDSSPPK